MERSIFDPTVSSFLNLQLEMHPSLGYIIFYLVSLFITMIYTFFGIKITMMVKILHFNLKWLYTSVLLFWVALMMSKIFQFIWQTFYYSSAVISINESTDGVEILRIAAFFRYLYMFFACATPLAVSIERGFATYYLSDYEKSNRPQITIVLICINLTLAVFLAIQNTFFDMPLLFTFAIVIFDVILSAAIFMFLYHYNVRQVYILDHYHRKTNYSLSKRFQLRENLRTLSMILKTIYAAICVVSVVIISILISIFVQIPQMEITSRLYKTIVDLALHCHPLLIVTIPTFFVPEMRAAFLKHLRRYARPKQRKSSKKVTTTIKTAANEGDVYFDLFQKSMSGGSDKKPSSSPSQTVWSTTRRDDR